jgi:uncharacterized protein (DUF58 family)
MSQEAPPGLDAQLLAEIEGLQLSARQVAHGALAGMHRSLRRGTSIEFSEHKLYTPGDDIRHIDWHAYAKSDRFHIKQFEDETNLRVELLIDHSGSMGFGSTETSKLDYARNLASAIAYLALRQGDAAGLSTFSEGKSETLPARSSSGHLLEVLHRLVRLSPEGPTHLGVALDGMAQRLRKRSLVIILSDLFDPAPDALASFLRLTARGHDVAVLHLLDRVEVDFPYENPALFASMEDERRLFIHPRTLRSVYVQEMQAFLVDTQRRLAEAGVDYHRVLVDEPPAHVLASFLRRRENRPAARALSL